MRIHIDHRTGLAIVVGLLTISVGCPSTAWAAGDGSTGPGQPTGLTAQRVSGAPNDFTLSWSPPAGQVDHFAVTIFADGQVDQRNVSATTDSIRVAGQTLKTVYQVRVAAFDDAGHGASSRQITVEPVLPGAPTDVRTRPTATGGGVVVSWNPPARAGLSAVRGYRVVLTDIRTGATSVREPEQSAVSFADASPNRSYRVTVAAETTEGLGLEEGADAGGLEPTAPQSFTAVRSVVAPGTVNLAWNPPTWSPRDPLQHYEIGSGKNSITSWTDVGTARSASVPLPDDTFGVYSVRAVNAHGPSDAADGMMVDRTTVELPPTAAYPVTVSSHRGSITATFLTAMDLTGDSLIVRLLPQGGWHYRAEAVIPQGSAVFTFSDVPNGKYRLVVAGLKGQGRAEEMVFSQRVVVNRDDGSASAVAAASFAEGLGAWRGVWPKGSLPRVVTSNEMVFDGSTALAITATSDLVGKSMAVGTGGLRVVPAAAGQQLTVSANVMPPTRTSHWVLGVSWWDANHQQILIERTREVWGTPSKWRPLGGSFSAPDGAVSASAFIEMSDVERGDTFFVDGFALRSYVEAPVVDLAG